MSSNPNGDAPLSPGHFPIGSQPTSFPEKSSLKETSSTKRFELVKTISDYFWKRWQEEYLSNLQPLSKWQEAVDALKTGDVVFIMEDNIPPLQWPRKVIFHGNDKIARVAEVFNGHHLSGPSASSVCFQVKLMKLRWQMMGIAVGQNLPHRKTHSVKYYRIDDIVILLTPAHSLHLLHVSLMILFQLQIWLTVTSSAPVELLFNADVRKPL